MLNFSVPKRTFIAQKWPKTGQWKSFFKVLTKKERSIFFVLLFIFLGNLVFLSVKFYFEHTQIIAASGGTLVEGLVGQPRFINPVYASSNDADRDLIELIFSGIMRYDENGELVYDLAKETQIEENGTAYRIFLKNNIIWSDSTSASSPKKLTADDIIFTIKTIQDPDYKSPSRANWINVAVEKVNDYEIIFRLKNPYAAFLENLTVKILPEHIWQNISAQSFPLSSYNQQPVGSGAYKIDSISQDSSNYIKSISLKINTKYSAGEKPYISEIKFKFFENEEDLLKAAKNGEINSFTVAGKESIDFLKNIGLSKHLFTIPRYFAVFFNPEKNKILSELKVRQALNYGTNKEEIIKEALDSQGKIVDSPIMPDLFGFNPPSAIYQFDIESAKSLLEKAGFLETEGGIRERLVQKEPAFQFKSNLQAGSVGVEVRELQKCLANYPDIYPDGEITGLFGPKTKTAVIKFQEKYADEILKPSGLTRGTGSVAGGTRKKLNELCAPSTEEKTELKIALTTVNQPVLEKVANLLKDQWKLLGVDTKIIIIDENLALERDIIKPRNYDAILFGEALGSIPDPFPFWDSIQKKDPGLNLAAYENKNADKLLEDARQTLTPEEQRVKLEKFQNILIEDAPAVFLYTPDYVYFTSHEIQNVGHGLIVDPSKRFSTIEKWYINTKRAWK